MDSDRPSAVDYASRFVPDCFQQRWYISICCIPGFVPQLRSLIAVFDRRTESKLKSHAAREHLVEELIEFLPQTLAEEQSAFPKLLGRGPKVLHHSPQQLLV